MKIIKRTVDCPLRQRPVEVTFAKTGGWLKGRYEVVSCPASHDSGPTCQRACADLPEYRSMLDFSTFNRENLH